MLVHPDELSPNYKFLPRITGQLLCGNLAEAKANRERVASEVGESYYRQQDRLAREWAATGYDQDQKPSELAVADDRSINKHIKIRPQGHSKAQIIKSHNTNEIINFELPIGTVDEITGEIKCH